MPMAIDWSPDAVEGRCQRHTFKYCGDGSGCWVLAALRMGLLALCFGMFGLM